ncbi:MAG: hypothetical protein N2440_03730 [Actinobacteria bacterium]|nr:hypothetical protein [Actinomycetota bacterium]
MKRIRVITFSLFIFFLAVFISWTLPGFPSFSFAATLLSLIYANQSEVEKSLLFGFIVGLTLDFITQEVPGINALALAAISFGVCKLKEYFSSGSLLWYFVSGFMAFVSRAIFVLFAHLLIDGTLLMTTDLKSFISAALWTGILSSVYFVGIGRN